MQGQGWPESGLETLFSQHCHHELRWGAGQMGCRDEGVLEPS